MHVILNIVNDNQYQIGRENGNMPVEVVSYMLSRESYGERVVSQMVLQCAPFLKGIKVASITNIEQRFLKVLRQVLKGTGITYRILNVRKGSCLVFFYRESAFRDYLERKEVCTFLRAYGYETADIGKVLQRLSARICRHSRERITFPHEIGVFLEYPIKDVEGFIRNEGRDYLLTGYWKVYDNPSRAQMMFHAYDQARKSAVNEFLAGRSIQEIAGNAQAAA